MRQGSEVCRDGPYIEGHTGDLTLVPKAPGPE